MSEDKRKLTVQITSFDCWEGYDSKLSHAENMVELQIYMGFMEESEEVLAKIKTQVDNSRRSSD